MNQTLSTITIKRIGLKVILKVDGKIQERICNNLEEAICLYHDYKEMIDNAKKSH